MLIHVNPAQESLLGGCEKTRGTSRCRVESRCNGFDIWPRDLRGDKSSPMPSTATVVSFASTDFIFFTKAEQISHATVL